MMVISFVRKKDLPDHVYVVRSDGSRTQWSFPSYGAGLPHDLVHVAVESVLGLRRGFWGRVDAGVDPEQVNAEANRRGGRDKYGGFGADLTELLLAEALAGVHWSLSLDELSDDARLALIRESCTRMQITLPDRIDTSSVASVRALLGRLGACWQRLLPKGTLQLRFEIATGALSFGEPES
jgi:hypothetical protein